MSKKGSSSAAGPFTLYNMSPFFRPHSFAEALIAAHRTHPCSFLIAEDEKKRAEEEERLRKLDEIAARQRERKAETQRRAQEERERLLKEEREKPAKFVPPSLRGKATGESVFLFGVCNSVSGTEKKFRIWQIEAFVPTSCCSTCTAKPQVRSGGVSFIYGSPFEEHELAVFEVRQASQVCAAQPEWESQR